MCLMQSEFIWVIDSRLAGCHSLFLVEKAAACERREELCPSTMTWKMYSLGPDVCGGRRYIYSDAERENMKVSAREESLSGAETIYWFGRKKEQSFDREGFM